MPRVADMRFVEDALRLFIVPEIERRQEVDGVEKPFALRRAQVVFSPDGRRTVRLNDEIELMIRVKADGVEPSWVGFRPHSCSRGSLAPSTASVMRPPR